MGSDSSFVMSRLGSISLARIEQCHAQDGHFQARYPASFPSCSGTRSPVRSQDLRCGVDDFHGAALRLSPSATSARTDIGNPRTGTYRLSSLSDKYQFLNSEVVQRRRSFSFESVSTVKDDRNSGIGPSNFLCSTRKPLGQLGAKLHGTHFEKQSRKSSPSGRRDFIISAAATADSDQTLPSQNGGGEKPTPTKPHPEVHPADVVKAQLKALREKDLATVFEFASPNNKARTGPLSRFSEMLEGRAYNVMIGHVRAEVLSTITISDNRFQQRIVIEGATGNKATFQWSLSRQEEGPFESCWMTDTVRRDE
ncbi:hypothetical protein Mapa_001183 [Marchantia paleacea]|nr:hypothetical protein Mapa_001183 [Marchantia paleacea]